MNLHVYGHESNFKGLLWWIRSLMMILLDFHGFAIKVNYIINIALGIRYRDTLFDILF